MFSQTKPETLFSILLLRDEKEPTVLNVKQVFKSYEKKLGTIETLSGGDFVAVSETYLDANGTPIPMNWTNIERALAFVICPRGMS